MKRTKVQCHDCGQEFIIKSSEPPQFCCFCTEPLLEKEKPMLNLDSFDEAEERGEDPWDEYDEDLDEDDEDYDTGINA